MKHILTFSSLFFLALTLLPAAAFACMCAPADDREEQEKIMKEFDIIATVEILDIRIPESFGQENQYFVRTLNAVKGNAPTEFEVTDRDSSCGNFFSVGDIETVGIERHTGNKFTLYNECAQILLDGYMAGHRNLDDGGETVTPLD